MIKLYLSCLCKNELNLCFVLWHWSAPLVQLRLMVVDTSPSKKEGYCIASEPAGLPANRHKTAAEAAETETVSRPCIYYVVFISRRSPHHQNRHARPSTRPAPAKGCGDRHGLRLSAWPQRSLYVVSPSSIWRVVVLIFLVITTTNTTTNRHHHPRAIFGGAELAARNPRP